MARGVTNEENMKTNLLKLPNGLGNGKCLLCGKNVQADEYGYYGDRATKFYCKMHMKQYTKEFAAQQDSKESDIAHRIDQAKRK
jgi:hypothetical protein